MRIIVFDEVSDVIDFISEQFRQRFHELGHEVFVIHMKHVAGILADLEGFIGNGVDFIFCINNSAFAFDKFLGMPFWDTVGAPLVDYLLDHPVSYTELLLEAPQVCFPVCVDENHPEYILKHCPNIQNSGFLPLGGAQTTDEQEEKWSDRPIDVLFVGYSRKVEAPTDEFAAALREFMIGNTDYTYEEAVEHVYSRCCEEEKSGKVSGKTKPITGLNLDTVLVRYMSIAIDVMGYFRQKMVRVLVENGVDVTVYGARWELEKDLMVSPYFHYMGITTAENCIRQMHHSKIVLNCMPWFKRGSHDRIPNAMMAGAISVTDPSEYLVEQFEDKKDIFYYNLSEIDKLPELIKEILQNKEENTFVRENAYNKAIEGHLWKYRADEILEVMG